jgi:hypothetical protein
LKWQLDAMIGCGVAIFALVSHMIVSYGFISVECGESAAGIQTIAKKKPGQVDRASVTWISEDPKDCVRAAPR